jgi:hypothetical protein
VREPQHLVTRKEGNAGFLGRVHYRHGYCSYRLLRIVPVWASMT